MVELYSVGVSIYLSDKLTAGMNLVSNAMMRAGQHTSQLQQKIAEVHGTMVKLQILGQVGGNMFHGGVEAIEGMSEAAKEYTFTLNKLQGQGWDVVKMHQAMNAAKLNSNRDLTTSYTSNLENIGDLNAALGSVEHAVNLLPAFTDSIKIMRTSGNMHTAHQADHMVKEGARALELSGDVGPQRSEAYQEEHIDMMRRAVTATNGLMTLADFHNFNKQAGVARTAYSDEYKYKIAPYFMQEQGGFRSGTSNFNINSALVQGVMTVKAAQNLQREGLITSKDEITKKNYMGITAHDIVGQRSNNGADFVHNPYRAVTEQWIPTIMKNHPEIAGMKDKTEQRQAIIELVNHLRLNGKATAYLALMIGQQAGVEKHIKLYDQVPKRVDAVKIADQNPVNTAAAAAAQWQNLLVTIGMQYLPAINSGLIFFAQVINQVNQFMEANPIVPKIIAATVAGFTLVGGLLAVGSSLGILLAACSTVSGGILAVGGLIAAAVAGAAGVFLMLQGDVRTTAGNIQKLWTAMMVSAGSAMRSGYDRVVAGLNALISPISSFFSRIAQFIAGLVSGPIATMSAAAHAGAQAVANPINAALHGGDSPNYVKPNQIREVHTHTKELGPITVNQRPGEDGVALAKRIVSMLSGEVNEGPAFTRQEGYSSNQLIGATG